MELPSAFEHTDDYAKVHASLQDINENIMSNLRKIGRHSPETTCCRMTLLSQRTGKPRKASSVPWDVCGLMKPAIEELGQSPIVPS